MKKLGQISLIALLVTFVTVTMTGCASTEGSGGNQTASKEKKEDTRRDCVITTSRIKRKC